MEPSLDDFRIVSNQQCQAFSKRGCREGDNEGIKGHGIVDVSIFQGMLNSKQTEIVEIGNMYITRTISRSYGAFQRVFGSQRESENFYLLQILEVTWRQFEQNV